MGPVFDFIQAFFEFFCKLVDFFRPRYQNGSILVSLERRAAGCYRSLTGIRLKDDERFSPQELNNLLYAGERPTQKALKEKMLDFKRAELYTLILAALIILALAERLAN